MAALQQKNPSDYAVNCMLGKLALASGEYRREGEAAFQHCLEFRPGENDEGHELVRKALEQLVVASTAPGNRLTELRQK